MLSFVVAGTIATHVAMVSATTIAMRCLARRTITLANSDFPFCKERCNAKQICYNSLFEALIKFADPESGIAVFSKNAATRIITTAN